MATILAKGNRKGVYMTVRVTPQGIYVNGMKNDLYDWAIYAQHLIGGTYIAEPRTAENALNTLRYHFFDEAPSIEVVGKTEGIPYEENVIY